MNKACKELIENAQTYNCQEIKTLYIINSGRLYNGLWGKNGYNNIIVLGEAKDKNFYILSSKHQTDVVNVQSLFENETCSIDISGKYNCVRVWFNKPLIVQYALSACCLVPACSAVAKKYGYIKE